MALAVDPAEVARLRAELLERYGLTEADVDEPAVAPAEVCRSGTPDRPEVDRIGPPDLAARYAVDPAEDARRRQLLAERRERIERRDRAEAALATAADAALDGLPLGIRWQSLDVDTFDADEPEPAPPSGHGAIVAALREWEALRPAWQHEAACRDVEDVEFFPEKGKSVEPAKAICARCPVAGPCKDYAVENGIRHGVWGGVAMGTRSRRKTA